MHFNFGSSSPCADTHTGAHATYSAPMELQALMYIQFDFFPLEVISSLIVNVNLYVCSQGWVFTIPPTFMCLSTSLPTFSFVPLEILSPKLLWHVFMLCLIHQLNPVLL